MSAIVTMQDVTKIYHMGEVEIRAADGISFEIEKGEFAVIVGPSGAGKTTVLNILGGMDTCDGGKVIVDGEDISGYRNRKLTTYRRNDIGFVFQFYNLVQNLTALENVELAAQICKNPLDAATVLQEVGLGDRMQNFPAQLSGGEQQRISIARALLNQPKVIIADEPTGNLDPETASSILQLLKDITATGTAIVMTTHNIPLIDKYPGIVYKCQDGKITDITKDYSHMCLEEE